VLLKRDPESDSIFVADTDVPAEKVSSAGGDIDDEPVVVEVASLRPREYGRSNERVGA